MKNKHGLDRNIPTEVKRVVRQRCGFGCVVCGSAIIDYEHIDPEFCNATRHDPQMITLLCPCCHAKVTRSFLSKNTVKLANEDPLCKKLGYAKDYLDFSIGCPSLQFPGLALSFCSIPIKVGGQALFEIKKPEQHGGPFRISGVFCDSKGSPSLKIIDNEWISNSDCWDIEVSGGSITIRENHRKINLRLRIEPPSRLIVEELDMTIDDYGFKGASGKLMVHYPNGAITTFVNCAVENAEIGISF